MKIVWIFLVNFSSSFLCSSTKKSIELDNDGSFKILQLSDLHLGTEPGKDVNTFDFINKLIDEIKPDLVANTGDTISGEYGSNYEAFFRNNWKKLSEIFIEKQ
jgi:predicted MPP superfamily phosphohydrolase